MTPVVIEGATHTFGEPERWDEAANGKCLPLAVRVQEQWHASAWRPSPEELARLNAGEAVVMHIMGHQPPCWMSVEPAHDE